LSIKKSVPEIQMTAVDIQTGKLSERGTMRRMRNGIRLLCKQCLAAQMKWVIAVTEMCQT